MTQVFANVGTFQVFGAGTNFMTAFSSILSKETAESSVQITIRFSAMISKLFVNISFNNSNVINIIRSRKNGANGNLVVSIPISATGNFEDTTNSDSLIAGDQYNYQVVGGTTGEIDLESISTIVDGPDATSLSSAFGSVTVASNNIRFGNILGDLPSQSSVETFARSKCYFNATLKNLFVRVTANGMNVSKIVRSRKNAADGNLSVLITFFTTGVFEDLTNSDSLVNGDLINYKYNGTGAGAGNLTIICIAFTMSATEDYLISAWASLLLFPNNSFFLVITGNLRTSSNESFARIKTRIFLTCKNTFVQISSNTITGSGIHSFRVNGISFLPVNIPASTTGLFENITDKVQPLSTDLINWQFIAGSGTGTITIILQGMNMQPFPLPLKMEEQDNLILHDRYDDIVVEQ